MLRLLPVLHRSEQQHGNQSNPDQASQLDVLKIANQLPALLIAALELGHCGQSLSPACVQSLRGRWKC
jgi:hypothetical protein